MGRVPPPPSAAAAALLMAAALLAGRPASAQPTPQPVVAPAARNLGQYTRAFQDVPAVPRYGHVAAATSNTLVLAGGNGNTMAPKVALPTNYMDSGGVRVNQVKSPQATRLDQMQMPLFRTAFDVASDKWESRDTGQLLAFGGPDFSGTQATNWLLRLQFGPTAFADAGALNWTWIDPSLPGLLDPRSHKPDARIGAAAAYLPNW